LASWQLNPRENTQGDNDGLVFYYRICIRYFWFYMYSNWSNNFYFVLQQLERLNG